jgi:N-acetylglucosaminyldiphosphoundecaprenol N-acetyl-beta-D-mannosaminyltransferase
MKKVQIVGFQVASVTMSEAIDWVERHIRKAEFAHIVTINPEIAWHGLQDENFAAAIRKADIIVPDGTGMLWAAKQLGDPLKERVAGFDLMQEMLKLAAQKEFKVFFLGAAPGVANQAALVALERYPRLPICGTHDGYFNAEEEIALVEKIREVGTDMLFCALGPPRPAELWIQKHKKNLAPLVAIGVGGSFNVLAGIDQRAPAWVQNIHMEWFYRAVRNPKRFHRLAAIPKFMQAVREQKKRQTENKNAGV